MEEEANILDLAYEINHVVETPLHHIQWSRKEMIPIREIFQPILSNNNFNAKIERDIRLNNFNTKYEEEEFEGHVGNKEKNIKNNKGDVLGTSISPNPKIKFIMKGDTIKDSKGPSNLTEETIAQDEEQENNGPHEEA